MRIVPEYFGLERTTVVYSGISGAGVNADEFLVLAEIGNIDETPAAARRMVGVLDHRCNLPGLAYESS